MNRSHLFAAGLVVSLTGLLTVSITSTSEAFPEASISRSPSSRDEKVTSPFFNCSMEFHASGKSVYIGIGYTELTGSGSLNCYDIQTRATQKIALKVRARGPGAGLGVTGLNISGGATGIGVAQRPERLLGHYLMVRGNAAAGVGAAVGSGLRLSNGAATINVSIESQTGLGADVDLLWVDVIAVDPTFAKPEEVMVREEPRPAALPADELPLPKPPAQVVESKPVVTSAPLTLASSAAETPVATVIVASASAAPVTTVELAPNQPLQILDKDGKLLQLIYVKQK